MADNRKLITEHGEDDVNIILPVQELPSSITSTNPRVNFSDIDAHANPAGDNEDEEYIVPKSRCGLAQPPGCRSHGPITSKLTYFQRVVAGSGHILNDLCASLWFTYFLLYMQKVAGFSDRSAAALMLLGQIVDGVSTPLIGYEADRANHCWLCKKGYGRCKTWHLVGVILVSLSFPFVFSPCVGCEHSVEWARAVYYSPFITIFQIGWASSQISHLALIPKMSSDILIRTELLAIRYGFTVIANMTVFLLTWVTLGFEDCSIDSGDALTFQTLALVSVAIGGFFSLLFHLFVVERTDEEIKRATLLTEADQHAISTPARHRHHPGHHHDFVESLSAVTNVRSVASSMAISKVHAQARRRRNSSVSSGRSIRSHADKEAGTSLLSDQDDMEVSVDAREPSQAPTTTTSPSANETADESSVVRINSNQGYSTKSLSLGKETVTVLEWLSMPQFYIVAIMYMSTRLSVNVTQVYMPLYLQETLKLECGSVATIPLTMYSSGFVVSLFIKMINKHFGRQLSYSFGAVLCITGACLILFLDWTPKSDLAEKGIYGVAVLLGGGASAILVTSLSITADMIGNNVENGAFVYGAMSFCDKLSCGLAVMLINEIKSFYPDHGFYQRVLGYTSGGCSLVGVLAIIGLTYIIYRQNRESEE